MWEQLYDTAVRWGFPAWGENDLERGFCAGLVVAAAVLVLAVLLWVLLKIIFRRRSLRGIMLKRESGDIFISRQAIQSALFSLSVQIPAVEIRKVTLFRSHGAPSLKMKVRFDPSGGSFDAVAEEFQKKVQTMLFRVFGIDSIKTVQIQLTRVPESKCRKLIAAQGSAWERDTSSHEPPAGI